MAGRKTGGKGRVLRPFSKDEKELVLGRGGKCVLGVHIAGGDTGPEALVKAGPSPQGQWDLPLQAFKQKSDSDRTESCSVVKGWGRRRAAENEGTV